MAARGDAAEDALGLPTGEREIPLLILRIDVSVPTGYLNTSP